MDTLCFGTPSLLRHLTFSEARNEPIVEVNLDKVLEGLALSMEQVHLNLKPKSNKLTRTLPN